MVLTSFVAATDGFGIDLFAQLVPDMRAGLVIGLAGLALGSLSDRIGLRAAVAGLWLHLRVGSDPRG